MRAWALAAALAAWAGGAGAQGLGALARAVPGESGVSGGADGLALTLALSQPVPWRLFTLDAPPRVVIDLAVVDWAGLAPGSLGAAVWGAGPPGWSRLVLPLPGPMAVDVAGMAVDAGTGAARLDLRLVPTTAGGFAAALSPPPDLPGAAAPPPAPEAGPLVVAIDPGHGGVDPGAERDGAREARLMLALGLELAEAVARAGMVPVLTRDADVFVPLQERMSAARAGGADVLVSLHADALEGDAARGGSVYVLSDEAVDRASRRMVERHGGADLIAGLDLSGQDDTVATALMDLARTETQPRSERLADAIVAALAAAGADVNGRARREAPLAVLNAPDFPSVLVEAGFLSDDGDRGRLGTPAGRAPVVAGIVAALRAWEAEDRARSALLRR